MDKIQKMLIKAGRKDLAQEYYLRTSNLKIASGTFKGLPTPLIRTLVSLGYGDDSKTSQGTKLSPLDKNTAIILQNQGRPVAIVRNEGYSSGYDIYNATNGQFLPARGINSAKKLKEALEENKIVFDKVISLEKMQIKRKENLYGEDAKLSPAELAKKKREKENATPLMDMDAAKNKVWIEKFMKSIPLLEKKLVSILGYNLKAKVNGANSYKYFTIEFTPEFSGDKLGVMQFALKKAGFYTYCNPSPEQEKIWFPIKLSWEHYDGGTNGGDVKVGLGGSKGLDLWYNTISNDWEKD
jgi:hypothetical protein